MTQEDLQDIFPELKESEDERIRKEIIDFILDNETNEGDDINRWLAWLEKQCEWKPAWSEEDKHRLEDTIYFLDTAKKHYASTVELDACINWLKSLKLQKQWKPSKEQIIALRWVLNNIPYNKHKEEISGLLDKIKKL